MVGAAPPVNVHPALRFKVTPVVPLAAPAVMLTPPHVMVIGARVVNVFVPVATFVLSEIDVTRLLLVAGSPVAVNVAATTSGQCRL